MTLFRMLRKTLLFLFCIILLPATAFSSDNADKEQAAIVDAGRWLAVVDQGNYTVGWNDASQSVKASTPVDTWARIFHEDRDPAGELISRKVNHSIYRIGPRGGELVEIWYDTSFRNMKSAVERVFTKLEQDGTWRVTAYVITPAELSRADILMALLLAAVVGSVLVMEVKSEKRLSNPGRSSLLPVQDGPAV